MSTRIKRFREFFFGPDLSPIHSGKHKSILLIAFYAWIGLGADGISSSCYGPEEAFLELGHYKELGLYLAFATAITVFIIAFSYNQVIELFPSGGGGYKVATTLLSPTAGVISGSALIIDYILTITISVASGFDALFSLLPISVHQFKFPSQILFIIFLAFMNLRGAKESIRVLMPIFMGFIFTHAFIILYGVILHVDRLPNLFPHTIDFTQSLAQEMGWFFVIALFLRAYSMGGGTYTGIEAVSNNINLLAEPRVATGKVTMLYMALSLSFTAGGIILLYLLWDVVPIVGQTLNAVTFREIMSGWNVGTFNFGWPALMILLFFEASLLFVAANTGFLGGPAVLANMASDNWMPSQFRHLSARLVTQNGILFMGIAAILILLLTHGRVAILIILYSINVFITYTLSLLGMTRYWWTNRTSESKWLRRILLSGFGFLVCASILAIIVFEKFAGGGWITLLITSVFVGIAFAIRHHYAQVEAHIQDNFNQFGEPSFLPSKMPPTLDPKQPTAAIFIDENRGLGMNTFHRIQTLFPGVYKNFIFIFVSAIEADIFRREDKEQHLLRTVTETLRYFVNYCHQQGLPATSMYAFGTDVIETTEELVEDRIRGHYTNCVFFAGQVLFENETWFTSWLYDHTPDMIQEVLHLRGYQMVLLPMTLDM